VVLPQPLGPMMLTNSLSRTEKIHIRECPDFACGLFDGFLKAFTDAADFNDRPRLSYGS